MAKVSDLTSAVTALTAAITEETTAQTNETAAIEAALAIISNPNTPDPQFDAAVAAVSTAASNIAASATSMQAETDKLTAALNPPQPAA